MYLYTIIYYTYTYIYPRTVAASKLKAKPPNHALRAIDCTKSRSLHVSIAVHPPVWAPHRHTQISYLSRTPRNSFTGALGGRAHHQALACASRERIHCQGKTTTTTTRPLARCAPKARIAVQQRAWVDWRAQQRAAPPSPLDRSFVRVCFVSFVSANNLYLIRTSAITGCLRREDDAIPRLLFFLNFVAVVSHIFSGALWRIVF